MRCCLTACLLFLTRPRSHLGQKIASQIASCWSTTRCLKVQDTPATPQDRQCIHSKPSFWIRKSPQQWHCKARTWAQSPSNRQGYFQKQSDWAPHLDSRSLDLYHSRCFVMATRFLIYRVKIVKISLWTIVKGQELKFPNAINFLFLFDQRFDEPRVIFTLVVIVALYCKSKFEIDIVQIELICLRVVIWNNHFWNNWVVLGDQIA